MGEFRPALGDDNCSVVELPADIVTDIAAMGMLAWSHREKLGHIIHVNGHPFVVVGYATFAEYAEAYRQIGFGVESPPESTHFLRVSTD